jgi:hypothetical protein
MLNIFLARFLMNVSIKESKKSPIAEAITNFLGNKTGDLYSYLSMLSKIRLRIMTRD